RPASDSFSARQPRKIKRKKQKQKQQPTASGVRSLFRRKRDLTPLSKPITTMLLLSDALKNERVGPGWGGGTVGAMDGAIELTWMYLQRVPPPHPGPTQHVETTSHDPLLLLLLIS
ncbi:TPA: hypothetical protein ACXI1P_001299, partial [Stenotrophomonas maltophilia]